MSGFTDEFYKEFTRRALGGLITEDGRVPKPPAGALVRGRPAEGLVTGEACRFWFEPRVVFEVKGADLSLSPSEPSLDARRGFDRRSPVHKAAAGLVHPERGVSLRFPRFLRERPDKSVSDATTFEDIAAAYRAQTQGQK